MHPHAAVLLPLSVLYVVWNIKGKSRINPSFHFRERILSYFTGNELFFALYLAISLEAHKHIDTPVCHHSAGEVLMLFPFALAAKEYTASPGDGA